MTTPANCCDGPTVTAMCSMNRAHGLQKAGRLSEAATALRDLVEYCEQAYGDPSLELFAALADLSDVLEAVGHPDYHEVFQRAHEVDDALVALDTERDQGASHA
jgi:hypothetical protein